MFHVAYKRLYHTSMCTSVYHQSGLYSCEQIRGISQQKLTSQCVSHKNRLQQQETRRKRVIEAHMKSRRCRRKELLGTLKTHDLMFVSCCRASKFNPAWHINL